MWSSRTERRRRRRSLPRRSPLSDHPLRHTFEDGDEQIASYGSGSSPRLRDRRLTVHALRRRTGFARQRYRRSGQARRPSDVQVQLGAQATYWSGSTQVTYRSNLASIGQPVYDAAHRSSAAYKVESGGDATHRSGAACRSSLAAARNTSPTRRRHGVQVSPATTRRTGPARLAGQAWRQPGIQVQPGGGFSSTAT